MGGGGAPPKAEKLLKHGVVPELNKMTKILGDQIENGGNVNFSLRFSYVILKFSPEFQISISHAHKFAAKFLNFFSNY